MLLSIRVTARLPKPAHARYHRLKQVIGIYRETSLKLIRQIEIFGTRGCVLAKEKGHQRCLMLWVEQELGTSYAKVLIRIPKMLIYIFKSLHLPPASSASKHKADSWHTVHPVAPLAGFACCCSLGRRSAFHSVSCLPPPPWERKRPPHSSAAPDIRCLHREADLNI